jgi:hypothetical protein
MSLIKKPFFVIPVFSLIIMMGCRGNMQTPYHVSQDVDFSFIKNVAVLPLENLSSEKAAGEIVRRLVISELLSSGVVDVVVPGEVDSAVKDLSIKNISSLDKQQIRELGKALNVQGIVMGSVEQYGYAKAGNNMAPEITITLMMADTGTGDIIWSVTTRRGGAGFLARHFGASSRTLSETSLDAVREAVGTLTGY